MNGEVFETAGAVAAALAAAWFVARYARQTWERTAVGRNLMLMAVSTFLLASGHVSRIWWGDSEWHAYATGGAFLVIAYDLLQRDCLRAKVTTRRGVGS